MPNLTAVAALVLGFSVDRALADELLWARKSAFGGVSARSRLRRMGHRKSHAAPYAARAGCPMHQARQRIISITDDTPAPARQQTAPRAPDSIEQYNHDCAVQSGATSGRFCK